MVGQAFGGCPAANRLLNAAVARCVVAALIMLVTALAEAAPAEARRIAFVIGNGRYEKLAQLANPRRDAAVIADRLRDLGFEVTEAFDADTFAMQRAADRFVASARGAELALFYYAGHGIQLFDRNFLLARDVDASAVGRPEDLGLDLTRLLEQLRRAGPVRQAVLIDACRENPFDLEQTVAMLRNFEAAGAKGTKVSPQSTAELTRRASRGGLASVAVGSGAPSGTMTGAGAETLVFFAAQPGAVVDDGIGQNSYFAEGLKEALAKPQRPLMELFRYVASYVRTVTKGGQVPQIVSDWTQDVVLGAREAARIEYGISAARDGQTLTEADRQLLIRSVSGFGKFSGDFIARASVGETADYKLTDAEKLRAKALGSVNGVKLTYDLDRDGREVSLQVYFRQVGYTLVVEKEGVRAETQTCFVSEEVTDVEIALRDIDGDRRPEVWIAFDGGTGWGTFCVLQYQGIPDLAERRRANTGQRWSSGPIFRTLLRGNAGWTTTVGTDNSIRVCGGSNCHSPASYLFENGRFTILSNEIDNAGPLNVPFRDEAERVKLEFAALQRATRPARIGAFTSAVPAGSKPGDVDVVAAGALGVGYECRAFGGNPSESLIVRQPARLPNAASAVSLHPAFGYEETLGSAPAMVDGTPCALTNVAEDKGTFRLRMSEAEASRCIPLLARGNLLTLPLSTSGGLLQVDLRSAGNASLIARAQADCRAGSQRAANVAALSATTVVGPTAGRLDPRPEVGNVRAPADSSHIAAFVTAYLASGTGAVGGTAPGQADIARLYPASIDYYKKSRSRQDVVADKLRYYARWPERSYWLDPATLRATPRDGGQSLIDVSFEYEFRVANGADARAGRGVTRLTLQPAGGGYLINSESGEVLQRR